MSKSNFFKHLSNTLARRRHPLLPPPLLLSTSIPTANRPPRYGVTNKYWKPSSFSLSTKTPLSFSSPTPLATELSPSSKYLSVRIRCPLDVADTFSEALLWFGASSASMDEEEDGHESSNNEVWIDSIFYNIHDVDVCLSRAADSIGLKKIPTYEVKVEEQCDWIQKSQESFHPVEVTKGLWIVPKWKSPPDLQASNIILDPGLAFGTGEHPTTKLCLLLLKSLIKGGELFLDYGTGSGILAIAAIKFGAARSIGLDIDPQAITSARHNAALNDIGSEMMELQLVPDGPSSILIDERTNEIGKEQSSFGRGKYDVVIANILLNPLLELADNIVSYAKPGAIVGISGILSEQLPDIMDQYSRLLEDISVSEMDRWACVSGRKKKIGEKL